MIQKGNWTGYYSFLDLKINVRRGFEKTIFYLEIDDINGNKFEGKIHDDLETGGTEGIGQIFGKVTGSRLEFVKRMPILTLMIGKDLTRRTFNKKHIPIYYSGVFSDDKLTVSGTWRIKFGFVWIGFFPVPLKASKGVWSMTFSDGKS